MIPEPLKSVDTAQPHDKTATPGHAPVATPSLPAPATRYPGRPWLIALFMILAAGWTLYHPYEPEWLYRAMPPHSLAVSDHTHLRDRWEPALTHPLVSAVAEAFGARPQDDLGQDTGTLALVWLLSGRLTVGAWIPFTPNPGNGPALIAISHVGGRRAALFRVLLGLRWVPGLGRLNRSNGGTLYWRPPRDKAWPGAVVAFAMHEGLLLASWSVDPDAVRTMLWRLEQHQPAAACYGGEVPWRDALEHFPHRLWISDAWIHPYAPGIRAVSLHVERMDPDAVRFAIGIQSPFSVEPLPPGSRRDVRLPPFVPDEAPALAATISPRRLPNAVRTALSALDESFPSALNAEEIFVWLTGAPYEGRLFGVLTPALFAALPYDAPFAMRQVHDLLDALNARWRLGLTYREAQRSPPAENAVWIEASRLSLGGLGNRESQSGIVAHRDGWLAAGTSATSWRRQVRVATEGHAPSDAHVHTAWRDWLARDSRDVDPMVVGWIDPEKLSVELLNTLAIYRLASLLVGDRDPAHSAMVERLADGATLLEALAPFGPLRLRAHMLPHPGEPYRLSLDVRIGADNPPGHN